MPKTWSDWLSFSKQTSLPRVLILAGSEHAYVEEALAHVQKTVLSCGLADFNYDKVDGKVENLESILMRANTLPMMANERLVEVRDAEKVIAENPELLEGYLRAPAESTVLLLTAGQLDMRLKICQLLDQLAAVFVFEHPKENEMPGVIRRRAQKYGLSLGEDAIFILAMAIGTDLMMLDRAFEKLTLVAREGSVSANDIELHVASTRLEDAFLLGRAVAVGDRKNALIMLVKLQNAREIPLKLVGLLAWQLRQVLKARLMLDQGRPDLEISKKLALFGDRARPVLQAARQWPTKRHVERLARLSDLDVKLKSSRASPWLWMEQTVFELC